LRYAGSLEGLAAALAAERITDEEIIDWTKFWKIFQSWGKRRHKTVIKKDMEFHQVLFSASRNDTIGSNDK
jgi:DNA-binding FadR family transcriptional regulator